MKEITIVTIGTSCHEKGYKTMDQNKLKEILKEHELWLCGDGNSQRANLQGADLRSANLRSADLRGAHLQGADLQGADLDFSCLPLWCGSLMAHFDSKQLKQIAYHLVKAGLQSKNATEEDKTELRKLIDYANGFHRVNECGEITR